MKTIKNAIKFCDIFGNNIELNIKQKATATTIFGGILAIITAGLILGAIWSMGNDIVYRKQPQTNFEEILFQERPTYYLNKTNFPLSFCFQDYDTLTYDIPKYFRFEIMTVKTFNTNSTTVSYNHEYEYCTYDHFPNLDKDYLENAGITKYFCLKDQNVPIGGYWDGEFTVYALLRLRLCNNETDGGTCAPRQEIEDFINSRPISFSFYFQNSIINPNDFSTPIQYYISLIYKNIRLSSSKIYDMFIGEQVITTDSGFMFEEVIKSSAYYFDSSDYDDSDSLVESLMDINLYVSNRKPIINRTYLKVQTILANVGGLAKALMLLGYCLSFYTSRFKLNKTILNKIIEFDIEKELDAKPEQSRKLMDFTPKNKLELMNESGRNIKTNVQRIQVHRIQDESKIILESMDRRKLKKKFKLRFFSVILKPCCSCFAKPLTRLKYSLYNKALKILISYLDISNIVHRFEEFEKLKLILFNEEQLAMFEFISKDFCSLDEIIEQKSEITRLKNLTKDKENLVKLILGYKEKRTKGSENLSSMDLKLLALMDSDLKNNIK
jgi:hypothetical protein